VDGLYGARDFNGNAHVWTASAMQEISMAIAPVGCIHVFGLFAQVDMPAGPDEVRRSGP
jgi:hypothetical protein